MPQKQWQLALNDAMRFSASVANFCGECGRIFPCAVTDLVQTETKSNCHHMAIPQHSNWRSRSSS